MFPQLFILSTSFSAFCCLCPNFSEMCCRHSAIQIHNCCIHTLHSILTLKELGLYILSTALVEFCYYINSLLLGELTFTFSFNSYTEIHTLIRFVMG